MRRTMRTTTKRGSMEKTIYVEEFYQGKIKRSLSEIDISTLKNCKYNPTERNESPKKLLEAVKEVGGLLEPIHVWGDDYSIIDGHGRVYVAREIGLTRVK